MRTYVYAEGKTYKHMWTQQEIEVMTIGKIFKADLTKNEATFLKS